MVFKIRVCWTLIKHQPGRYLTEKWLHGAESRTTHILEIMYGVRLSPINMFNLYTKTPGNEYRIYDEPYWVGDIYAQSSRL